MWLEARWEASSQFGGMKAVLAAVWALGPDGVGSFPCRLLWLASEPDQLTVTAFLKIVRPQADVERGQKNTEACRSRTGRPVSFRMDETMIQGFALSDGVACGSTLLRRVRLSATAHTHSMQLATCTGGRAERLDQGPVCCRLVRSVSVGLGCHAH